MVKALMMAVVGLLCGSVGVDDPLYQQILKDCALLLLPNESVFYMSCAADTMP